MSHLKGTWTTWVEEHYALLLSRATALFHGNTELASDFLHDLLLELRRKWEGVENPLAWISTTMRYRMVDTFAKQKKMSTTALPEETQGPNDPALQMDIEAALHRLPPKLKEVISLFLEGNNILQIAAKTELTTDAVYQRLSRARKQLKQSLAGGRKPLLHRQTTPRPTGLGRQEEPTRGALFCEAK